LILILVSITGRGANSAADLARTIRDAGLDPAECYRVRDLSFNREDLKFYLTEGFLIFARPVNGHRLAALFSADVEAGDAELILIPPSRSERQSLGSFTGSPNLDEHFNTALFIFSDRSGDELLERTREAGSKTDERGVLLASQYASVVRNLSESFQMRMVEDQMSPSAANSFFFAAIGGRKLGNFDVIYDPRAREQIMVGQFVVRNEIPRYDIWTSFESRLVRNRKPVRAEAPFKISDYRIQADLDDNLGLSAVTQFKLTPAEKTRVFALNLSTQMQLRESRVGGQPVEAFTSESLRSTAIRGSANRSFLIVTPEPLEPGRTYEFEFKHAGNVVFKAGNDVYAVGSRGTWYPQRGGEFTTYDLTFRYPKRLNLVATGELVEERTEGDRHISRRRTSGPVRFAGFNLGNYERIAMNRSGYAIEVYGNKRVEPPLELKQAPPLTAPPRVFNRRVEGVNLPDLTPGGVPQSRLTFLANEIAGAFEFMMRQFGPPPLKTLTVAPIPGTFGQGFPGLVYLSTLSYIPPDDRPAALREKSRQTFFSDVLAPHEVAHQWWGNLVTSEAYQDAWLMEALANYSALLYLEKRKGSRAVETTLEQYRGRLLDKRQDGNTVESLGPITWGTRLETSEANAARTIVYEKGSWILHMLRLRMGDERFFKMLNELCRRFQYKTVSTDAFRDLAEESLGQGKGSLEGFFEIWVHGTGIPALKVSSSLKGKAPALKEAITVTQSGVDEDFSIEVPVEIQTAGSPTVVKWVRTSSEPVTVTIPVKRPPAKVQIPPSAVLATR
jgi:hypothetical protein